MKCPSCGSETPNGAKFCPSCGAKIGDAIDNSPQPSVGVRGDKEVNNAAGDASFADDASIKKSAADVIRDKGKNIWNNLNTYEKIAAIAIAFFVLIGLVAFLAGKTASGVIAILQILLIVIALLMKKGVIKTPKTWIYIIAFALAVLLLIPYVSSFCKNRSNAQKYAWSDIVLSEELPVPTSKKASIHANTNTHLSMEVVNTSYKQYSKYMELCRKMGFSVDAEQTDASYTAFNESGFKLALGYTERNKIMSIMVDAPHDYGTLKWPTQGLATLIPAPISLKGQIQKDDSKTFSVIVSGVSPEEYAEYVESCAERDFVNSVNETDKHYYAVNTDGYRFTADYQGNSTVFIMVEEPEYTVNIEVECVENWFFSKYDIEVYVDDQKQETLTHGSRKTYSLVLTKGTYEIKFVNDEDDAVTGSVQLDILENTTIKYRLSCTKSKIDVEAVPEESDSAHTQEPMITNAPTEIPEVLYTPIPATEIPATATPITPMPAVTAAPEFTPEPISESSPEPTAESLTIVLPQEGSKLAKDFDSKSSRSYIYGNVDGTRNVPKLAAWGSCYVTDSVLEYFEYLKESGCKVTATKKEYKEPFAGFTTYDTDFKVVMKGVTWTMNLSIQNQDYVEYILYINLP